MKCTMRFGLQLFIGLFALTPMQAAVADEPRSQRIQIEAEPPSPAGRRADRKTIVEAAA